jgi:hypothetical protein
MDLTTLSDDELLALEARAKADPSVLQDVMVQAPIGLARGAAFVAGMPGDTIKALRAGVGWLGLPTVGDENNPETPMNKVLGSDEIIQGMESVTGEFPEPQTSWGQGVRTAAEFVPSAALGPGSLLRKGVGYVALPTATTEGGGKVGEVAGGLFGNAELGEDVGRMVGGITGLGIGAVARNPMRTGKTLLADKLSPDAKQQFDWLGSEAMLGEGTPASFGLMQGVGSRPDSAGMNTLVDAVTKRDSTKNLRVKSDVDAQLGPAEAPSAVVERIEQRRTDKVNPHYEPIVEDPRIAIPKEAVQGIEYMAKSAKGDTLKRLESMRGMLQPEGKRTDISARGVLNARGAIDDMIEIAKSKNQKDQLRVLTIIRKKVDEALVAGTGGDIKAVDALAEKLHKQKSAVELGASGKVLSNAPTTAMWPSELAKTWDDMNNMERVRLTQGVRGDIERIVGTNANDVNALNRMLKGDGDWNKEKLTTIFGADKTNSIFNTIARERHFQENFNKIVGGSQTAQRRAGQEAVARGTVNPPPITLMQGAGMLGRKAVDSVTNGFFSRRDADLANRMVTQGTERDQMLQELLKIKGGRKRGVPWASGISTLLSPMQDEE